jgi:outer membrane protein OmpA-like peptidoglycan-associated protein
MYKWQPSKWLILAPVMAGLPLLAAYVTDSSKLVEHIAVEAQKAAGDWSKVEVNGRDAKIEGQVPDQQSLDAAVKEVAGTYGVRAVDSASIKIVPLAALAPPTIAALTTNQASPEIKGSWAEGEAKTLSVTLNGKTYTLGTDKELSSTAGAWTLKLAAPLSDGSYDVSVTESDGATRKADAAQPGKLVIDTVAPAAPAVIQAPADAVWPRVVMGTWAEGDATGLGVKLLDKTYTLGVDPALTSDGKGNFSFAPKVELKPGSYDLDVVAADAAGNATMTKQKAAIVVPEPAPQPAMVPIPPASPAVDAVPAGTVWPYAITGSWPEDTAKSLTLGLAGKEFTLGQDKEVISTEHGKFTFAPVLDLKPGSYDLTMKVADADGKVTETTVPAAVVVAEVAPVAAAEPPAAVAAPAAVEMAAPTIESVTTDSDRPTVKGTWPSTAKGFAVELDGVTHTLGKDPDITSDDAGHWTLTPAKPVVNGTYDIIAQASDGNGKTINDASKDELTVNVAPPPPAPPADQPYDCNATLARIAAVFPVRFAYDHSDLISPFAEAVNQYSALLGDKRCLELKVEVAGHADERGSEAYNQKLSEARAKTVIDALVAAKIDATRLNGVGYSKDKPLDPAHTKQAHAKNRRVEFTAQ